MDTPKVDRSAYELVYEPREDSFLFLDALELDVEHLRTVVQPVICVEVGPGSGIIMAFVSALLATLPMVFLGSDINSSAPRIAQQTFKQNGGLLRPHRMDCIRSDLLSGFGNRLDGKVDLLLFNPPYVPSDDEELGHADIRAAWAGGKDGMQVTDRFLKDISRLLSPNGCCYVVFVAENDPLAVARMLAEKYHLMPKQIAKRQAKNERLSVWRFTRRKMKVK